MVHDCGPAGTGDALSPVLAQPAVLARDGLVLAIERPGQPALAIPVTLPDFGALISTLAAERRLGPGTIVGTGALAEVPALAAGDSVRIELRCGRDRSLLGAIERKVV
jgi:hypothetical protein